MDQAANAQGESSDSSRSHRHGRKRHRSRRSSRRRRRAGRAGERVFKLVLAGITVFCAVSTGYLLLRAEPVAPSATEKPPGH